MSAEQLHDALNYLDDDMIEAVENLRSRKKKIPVFRIAAVAACLCLLAGVGISQFGQIITDNTQAESALGHYAPMETVADAQYNTSGSLSAAPVYCILLSDLEQTAQGVTGTVAGGETASVFPMGTKVTVVFPQKPEAAEEPVYGLPVMPSSAPENAETKDAAEITVRFTLWEETKDGIVIYADRIGE